MKEIKFSVGAKAARLIGRENIADVDGALIELIKNAYDADASSVLVKFLIPFPDVPVSVDVSLLKDTLSKEDLLEVMMYYDEAKGRYRQKKNLVEEIKNRLQTIFFSYNKIIVADNGCGMSEHIVETSWMIIGTRYKETNYVTPNGRIKTGAKGIGRFALDKLSESSVMYTKGLESKEVLKWSMNWNQFVDADLIDDVKAEFTSINSSYKEIVKKEFNHINWNDVTDNWDTGTMIVLNCSREAWSKRLFKKININLASINPIGNVDKFDVNVYNQYFLEYNYRTEKVAIDESNYDYRLKIKYDGNEDLIVNILRNEVDLSKKTYKIEKYEQYMEKSADEFWNRKNLQVFEYTRDSYDQEISRILKVKDIIVDEELDKIQSVGPFEAELYFLRRANSPEYDIMKRIPVGKRKDLTKQFSGIKIYRDEFKVRPYGDEGSQYDWLNLGVRSQKSPAAVSGKGRWRVEPYQMIGWVKISRDLNPILEDMANREGIALTDSYYMFVELLQAGIDAFEYDRQYVYREYSSWKESVEKEMFSYVQPVINAARNQNQKPVSTPSKIEQDKIGKYEQDNHQQDGEKQSSEAEFTNEELFGTVQTMVDESDREKKERQMLQILSASGILMNTFFHEFSAINTQFHVRAAQLRSRINYLLDGKEYTGLEAYNPYMRIDALEKNDKVIAAFLDVVMKGLKQDNLIVKTISLESEIYKILAGWKLIVADKKITIGEDIFEASDESYKLNIAIVDLYIILNNFLLNAVWFLEKEDNKKRTIYFNISNRGNEIIWIMGNNGPGLAEKFLHNPQKIFELGESSKGKEGTGLGLWTLKDAVERNNGDVSVSKVEDGFELTIVLKKVVS